jgi:naphthalene 1,2-dioxygenase ferredoxin reductase component
MIITNIINIRKPSADKAIITLAKPDGFSYLAGQYLSLACGPHEARFYSIANTPSDDVIEIHVRDNGRGGMATYIVQEMIIGDVVTLEGPYGQAVWHTARQRPLLLLAGGMGISPMKAIAEEAIRRGHNKTISLYWGIREEQDNYLAGHFEDLCSKSSNFSLSILLGDDFAEAFSTYPYNLDGYDIYVSGPPLMLKALTPLLISKGANKASILSDV